MEYFTKEGYIKISLLSFSDESKKIWLVMLNLLKCI